jgi:hypothetical protein
MCLICSEILIVCPSVLVAEFLDWAIIVVVSHSEFPLLEKLEQSGAATKAVSPTRHAQNSQLTPMLEVAQTHYLCRLVTGCSRSPVARPKKRLDIFPTPYGGSGRDFPSR